MGQFTPHTIRIRAFPYRPRPWADLRVWFATIVILALCLAAGADWWR